MGTMKNKTKNSHPPIFDNPTLTKIFEKRLEKKKFQLKSKIKYLRP